VCGDYTIKLYQKTKTPLIKKAYELYFGCKIGDQDKPWAPHIVCANCAVYLKGWLIGSRKAMPFAVKMVWQEQKKIMTDCYFCLTKIYRISLKSKHSTQYPLLPSTVRPALHSQDLPVPKPPEKWTIYDDNNDDEPIPMK
jgi:hypothetical protein